MKMRGNTKDQQECGATGTLTSCRLGCELVQPLAETVLQYLLDLNLCLPYAAPCLPHSAALPLLGIHPTKATGANQDAKMETTEVNGFVENSGLMPTCSQPRVGIFRSSTWLD